MTTGEAFTLFGYMTGTLVLWLEARRRGLDTEGMRLVAVCGLVGGVLGAKVVQWCIEGGLAADPLAILNPRLGGKALLGGLGGGWLAVELAKRRLGIRRRTGDLWALALPAGEAVGRIGCWFNGCCFGTACNPHFPLAVWQHGAWRQPAQLYSAVLAALIFGLLWRLRNKTIREGDLWKLFLMLYGLSRFAVEFVRQRDIAWAGLSTVQLICLETAVLALITYGWSFRRHPAPAMSKSS
jgi:phosphatidylglycerol:prolipoprotein diacylglycerol transferase